MNFNTLLSDSLSSALPGMTNDVQSMLVWGGGCFIAILAVRKLKDTFDVMRNGGTDHEVTEGQIFRQYQRGGGRAKNYDKCTEKQHMKEAENLWRKHKKR